MTKRLKILSSLITPCVKFADVGCDHGLIAQRVLKEKLAKQVVISDISQKSLQKAVKLLSKFDKSIVTAIVSDGFKNLPKDVDQAIIAGMGGEEIVGILKDADVLPFKLILQPMKNPEKVREAVLSLGYKIEKDFVFFDSKFYFVIVATRGQDSYTVEEIAYGRDNLKFGGEDFISYLKNEIEKTAIVLAKTDLSDDVKKVLSNKLTELNNVYEATRNL